MKKKTDYSWVIKTVIISFVVSVVFTFASAEVLGSAGYIMAFVVLAVFIAIGIVFDIIGVAVTAATEKPFHSMASHRVHGAAEALALIRNAEKVGSFCNDIVGDVSGIVSGATAVIIAAKLINDIQTQSVTWQIIISGIVAALTIGGKAMGKAVAINRSTEIVFTVGRILHFFGRLIPKRKRKK